ncbi:MULTISPECIES: PucR family transcriptional regulator [Brevibacillus]|uniref:PucR family transcriptional regulator n=1 Tax=Brevibacillus TaxID=55080 RepID=UPI00156B1649|nr:MULTISPECIES: PucR family transcriptional regulator [Brevibacillus]MBU8712609.1 PucR family transcriptional regulator ligand-binding domain-containing protein [Brevibacillus parabrevis]NRQ52634.1 PucR family transcriptional regulator ligand-binding domain-containing protein [Brevibacillus sp. HD1.4A]
MENSPFTVERLLQLPVFRGSEIMAGHEGIAKEIYYISSVEMPDLTGFLRPNELIITTGYAFRHEPMLLCRLLDEMHRIGSSAIGIKTRRVIQEVPAEALYKSNLYGIPLFDIPLENSFIDMTHAVIDQVLQRQAFLLREVREVNQQFTNLVLNRRTTELVVLIGNMLACEAAVLKEDGEIESATSQFDVRQIQQKRPIQVGSRVMGYLAISRELKEQERFEQMCLDHAVTVLAIDFTIRQSQQLQREREQESFLVELFSGSAHQEDLLRYRAKQLGISLRQYHYVIVMRVQSKVEMAQKERDEQLAQVYHLLLQKLNKPGVHVRKGVVINDSLLVLCSSAFAEADKQKADAEALMRELALLHEEFSAQWQLAVGIGGAREHLADVPASSREAYKAIAVGAKTRPKQEMVHYHEILVEDLLLDNTGHPVLAALTSMLIEPLVRYDEEYGTELLATLGAFLQSGGNTKRVAEEMFIHRNSVLYRLERIGEILQTDLNDPEVRFRLDVAMRVWKTQGVDIHSFE